MVSGADLFFSLFNNLAIFIALTAIYGYFLGYFEKSGSSKKQTITGMLFGVFAIGCMYAKIPVYEGVIVDQRNAIIALSGVCGGPLSAIISAVMAGCYRLYLGGSGALAGVIGICLAGIAGICLKRLLGRLDTLPKAFVGALLATIIILPGFLFVEDFQTGFNLMKSMAFPYGVAIFLGISLVGLLLNRQEELFEVEKAYRQSEEKYREVVEGTTDLITYVNEKGQFIYINRMSEEILGVPPDTILNMSAFDFVHPDDKQKSEKHFLACLKDRLPSTVIENRQVNKKNGDVHTMLWTINYHYDQKGNSLGASGIAHDITQRKLAEEQIYIFNELLNKSNDAIFVIDPDTALILDVNTKACDNLGYSKKELLTMKVLDLDMNFSRGTGWEKHVEEIRKNSFLLIEDQYKKKDGTIITMEISITISHYGDREYITAVARDLTKRKALETQLNHALRMEAIGRVTGGIAHDLNNLLTPILGYGEMLMIDTENRELNREGLKNIIKAGKSSRDLVGQLLAFSRKQVLEYHPLNINQVLDGFENLIRRTIREDIAINIIKSSEILPVMADIGQIEQVVMNLSVNAADAMPDGGKLSIETSLVELDEKYASTRLGASPGHFVMLSFSDTGHGMSEEIQLQIFEPFFSTKGDQGTGLGLATVYGIVKQHKGNIWVYSERGRGTTFKIYLPVSDKVNLHDRIPPVFSTNLRGSETILLVEDNDEVRSTAYDILQQQGYTVLLASNGEDALEKMSSQKTEADLLLTDVVMPDMNGKELYTVLSQKFPTLKVLYMSGYTGDIIVKHGLLNKGVQFLQKPFSVHGMIAKVREVIDN